MENRNNKESPPALSPMLPWDDFLDISQNEALDHTGSLQDNNCTEPFLQESPVYACPEGISTGTSRSYIDGIRVNGNNFMARPTQSNGFWNQQIAGSFTSCRGKTSVDPRQSSQGRAANDTNAMPSVLQFSDNHRPQNQNNFLSFGGCTSLPCHSDDLGELVFGNNVMGDTVQSDSLHIDDSSLHLGIGGDTTIQSDFPPNYLVPFYEPNGHRGWISTNGEIAYTESNNFLMPGTGRIVPNSFSPSTVNFGHNGRSVSSNSRMISTQSNVFHRPGASRSFSNYIMPSPLNSNQDSGNSLINSGHMVDASHANNFGGRIWSNNGGGIICGSNAGSISSQFDTCQTPQGNVQEISPFPSGRVSGLERDLYSRYANIYPHGGFQPYPVAAPRLDSSSQASLFYNEQAAFPRMASASRAVTRTPNVPESTSQQQDYLKTVSSVPLRPSMIIPFTQAIRSTTGQDQSGQIYSFGDRHVAQVAESLRLPKNRRPGQQGTGGISQIPHQGKPDQIKGSESAKVLLGPPIGTGSHHPGHRMGSLRSSGQTKGKSAKVLGSAIVSGTHRLDHRMGSLRSPGKTCQTKGSQPAQFSEVLLGPAIASAIHHPEHRIGSFGSPDIQVPVAERSRFSKTYSVPRKSRYQRSSIHPNSTSTQVSRGKATPQPSISSSLPSSDLTNSTYHVKWKDEEPREPIGVNCSICERDLRNTPPGAVSEPSKLPCSAVLPCQHTFHYHCLQFITPNEHSGKPPCIICASMGLQVPD